MEVDVVSFLNSKIFNILFNECKIFAKTEGYQNLAFKLFKVSVTFNCVSHDSMEYSKFSWLRITGLKA